MLSELNTSLHVPAKDDVYQKDMTSSTPARITRSVISSGCCKCLVTLFLNQGLSQR